MGTSRRVVLIGVFGIFSAAVTPIAQARRGGGRRVSFSGRGLAHGTHHSGPVLSRAELQQCVNEQNTINALSDALDSEQASWDADQKKLGQLERRLENDKRVLNVYSQESVDSFNTLVDQHRKQVTAFNRRLPVFNEKVERLKSSVAGFNSRCAQRAYYESDMSAVLAAQTQKSR